MSKRTKILIILLSIWMIRSCYLSSWVNYDKSVTVRRLPVQEKTTKSAFAIDKYKIKPVASFDIEARLLSKRKYWLEKHDKLSPYDFALGWGPMSNYEVLKKLRITQFHRWYYFKYKEPPILVSEITRHSSNMHLIPANKQVLKKMKKVRRGEIVRIKGYLVNVTREDGWNWRTSVSRTDTRGGACEIVWVESMEIK